jgi:hypothetical protein
MVRVVPCQQLIENRCVCNTSDLSGLCDRKLTTLPKAETLDSTIRLLDLHELTDMNGKPMGLDRRFLLHAENSNPSRRRMVDWEDNKRQIVFNPSRNNGIYLRLDKKYLRNTPCAFGLYHPGGDAWLLGNLSGSSDVTLGKNQLSSHWYFTNESTDNYGHKCYEIWAKRSNVGVGGKFPIYMPTSGLARAGYDKKWEWATYGRGIGAPEGFFKVKFQLIE